MLTYIILTGIVVVGFVFVMWLGTFLLNRSINTTLETAAEGRRNVAIQLGYGGLLLGLTVFLCVIFFQMDRQPVIPEMPPGLQPEGVRRLKEAPEASTKSATPSVQESVSDADTDDVTTPNVEHESVMELNTPPTGSLVS